MEVVFDGARFLAFRYNWNNKQSSYIEASQVRISFYFNFKLRLDISIIFCFPSPFFSFFFCLLLIRCRLRYDVGEKSERKIFHNESSGSYRVTRNPKNHKPDWKSSFVASRLMTMNIAPLIPSWVVQSDKSS